MLSRITASSSDTLYVIGNGYAAVDGSHGFIVGPMYELVPADVTTRHYTPHVRLNQEGTLHIRILGDMLHLTPHRSLGSRAICIILIYWTVSHFQCRAREGVANLCRIC